MAAAGGFTVNHSRWGVSETYTNPLLNKPRYEASYFAGASAGSLSFTATPLLDGTIVARDGGGTAPARQRHRRRDSGADLARAIAGRRLADDHRRRQISARNERGRRRGSLRARLLQLWLETTRRRRRPRCSPTACPRRASARSRSRAPTALSADREHGDGRASDGRVGRRRQLDRGRRRSTA